MPSAKEAKKMSFGFFFLVNFHFLLFGFGGVFLYRFYMQHFEQEKFCISRKLQKKKK